VGGILNCNALTSIEFHGMKFLRNFPAKLTAVQKKLRAELDGWMQDTSDPRLNPNDDRFEKSPYFGDASRMPAKTPQL
jgi:hypothetical protein